MDSTESKPMQLNDFVETFKDFVIVVPDAPYNHMGATITDAILQAGLKWSTVVKPRLDRLRCEYPEAGTTCGFQRTIEKVGIKILIDWKHFEKPNRIMKLTELFVREGVETEGDLKTWLGNTVNIGKLGHIRGIGNKTNEQVDIFASEYMKAIRMFRELVDRLKGGTELVTKTLRKPNFPVDYSLRSGRIDHQINWTQRRQNNMSNNPPTLEAWRELYSRAIMFKELAPWQWMDDSMVFGVQNPQGGEIGYCCIMGTLGEVLGMAVYLGSEGLGVYEKMQLEEISPEDEDVGHLQKCLIMIFDDRDQLDKNDLEVTKKLGLKFRGKQEWPLFRSYEPGYMPWPLSAGEVEFLTIALCQAMGVAESLRENRSLLCGHRKGEYLVMAPEEGADGDTLWSEKWLKPAPWKKKERLVPLDEIRLKKIGNKVNKVSEPWEVDFFYAPFVVKEEERPYFPFMALYVASNTGVIVHFTLSKNSEHPETFQQDFLDLLENAKVLPQEIIVKQEATYDFFKPIADTLGIKLRKAKHLKALQSARSAFMATVAR